MRSGKAWPAYVGSIGSTGAGLAAWMVLVAGFSGPALAHTAERGFVLTLPTGLYIAGGAIVVGVSFLLIVLVPAANLRMVERAVWRAGRIPQGNRIRNL